MNFQLQVRRPHERYQTIESSCQLQGLLWGWRQYQDPRYFAGWVRIVDVSEGSLRIVMRQRVEML
jgi:hypothetical protein